MRLDKILWRMEFDQSLGGRWFANDRRERSRGKAQQQDRRDDMPARKVLRRR